VGILPQKFQKTRLGYWRHLLPNFTPIGEVPAEKTVTDENEQTNSKFGNPPILRMEE